MAHRSPAGNIPAFSNDLDKHCCTHANFFDLDFLLLFEKHFGYRDISLSAYTSDYKFCGGVAINDAKPLQDYYKKNKVYEFDEYAAMISRQCRDTDSIRPLIVNSLESLPAENKITGRYHDFLRKFGFRWTATMVFGSYRFSIHKKDSEKFSPEEIDFLNQIHTLLLSRTALYEQLTERQTALEYYCGLLDDQKAGCVLMNESLGILSCNDTARRYLSELSGQNNMENALKALLLRLNLSPALLKEKESISLLEDGKLFTVKKHMEKQQFDFFTEKYTLSILPAGENSAVKDFSRELFREKYGITEKEQQVIDRLLAGDTYAKAADRLLISINTLRTHVKNIYSKTDVSSQRELAALYKLR